jgi:hypothetical protein
MKKFLLGAVCALTVSSTSFAQMYGNDKGNGGDAVMINNEMVMRDFVSGSNLTPISDTFAFVKSVPDLKSLIAEIAQANSRLALNIIYQLTKANFFNSRASLDILPSATTAIGGPRAEVQLAIRWDNDIVLAPEFKDFKEKSYLLVHEALHGVNYAAGALHHERVRTVVNYLKTNRGHYTTQGLLDVLKYTGLGREETLEEQVAFDKTVPMTFRCSVVANDYGKKVSKYLNLDCGEFNYLVFVVREYLPGQINFSYLSRPDDFDMYATYSGKEIEMVAPISLPSTRFFEPSKISNQKSACWTNGYDLKEIDSDIKELQLAARVQRDVANFFKRSDISVSTKQIVLDYFEKRSDGLPLAESAKILQNDLAKYSKNKATLFANNKRCIAKFGSNF